MLRLFNCLAALPILAMPRRGAIPVQPVYLGDVVAGVVALLESPPSCTGTIAFVGPKALALRDYLAQLRRSLAIGGRLRVLPMPETIFLGGPPSRA